MTKDEIHRLLANKTVMFLGDSHTRHAYAALLALMGKPGFNHSTVLRHMNINETFPENNTTLHFSWAAASFREMTYHMREW